MPSSAYTALNLLVAHPTGLYALRQFSHNPSYYTLSARPGQPGEGAAWVVASEPTDDAPGWEALAPGVLYQLLPNGNLTEASVA